MGVQIRTDDRDWPDFLKRQEEAGEKAWYFALRFMHFGPDEVLAEHRRGVSERNEHRKKELGKKYNSHPLSHFEVFETHTRIPKPEASEDAGLNST